MKARNLLLMLGVLASAGLAVFGDRSRGNVADGVVEAVTRATPVTPARAGERAPAGAGSDAVAADIQRLHERPAFVRRTEKNLRENVLLFAAGSWEPPAKPAVSAPPVASAPPLPYVYVGRKFQEGAWEVYLASGEELRVARRLAVLDAHYRVDDIHPPVLSLTYLPLNLKQTMNIGSVE